MNAIWVQIVGGMIPTKEAEVFGQKLSQIYSRLMSQHGTQQTCN